jgi:hypothetical protein
VRGPSTPPAHPVHRLSATASPAALRQVTARDRVPGTEAQGGTVAFRGTHGVQGPTSHTAKRPPQGKRLQGRVTAGGVCRGGGEVGSV